MNETLFSLKKTIAIVSVFSIAMGVLEGVVVVYLRKIYYPDGFVFPLAPIEGHIAITEIIREAATIIMLIAIGMLSGRTKTERFGFFIFSFGVWDICYYVLLYFALGWPSTLFTWDILFLIPVTWVGPVLGPLINSLTMMGLALLISYFTDKSKDIKLLLREWVLLVFGSIIVIVSYTKDYVTFMNPPFSFWELLSPSNTSRVMEMASSYVPVNFSWWIFILGEAIILSGIGHFAWRNKKSLQTTGG
ncbi:MAG: hypothetical protein K9G76_08670 [Bacteroidales bacterium]|nr:hypothetical protein [Bacteroidales bacterium]MCF8404439.1 hypothetical protein [Bacteroidales bacterium]